MKPRRLTPAGRAGVAVLRLDAAREQASPLTDAHGRARPWPAPGEVRHVHWRHAGELIDECVAVGREQSVELHVHAGAALLARAAAALGVELHEPQPDAPGCLRAVAAEASARWGWMASVCEAARAALADGRVESELAARVEQALARQTLGRRLSESARVQLVGPPNAGKSTLFNALLADERALVSSRAGTTRDAVEAAWQLAGVPVRLIDTAGEQESVAPTGVDTGADLLLHVRGPGQPRGALPGPGVAVCTHADLEAAQGQGAELVVSGRTGAGLDALRAVLARRLGLEGDAHDDVRAPLDAATRELLRAVQALATPSD